MQKERFALTHFLVGSKSSLNPKGIIIAHARADIFDYIERFDNPRKLRKLEHEKITQSYSINLSVKSG